MKRAMFMSAFCLTAAAFASGEAFAQAPPSTQIDARYMTVDGEVVRYDAGQVIVIRGADRKDTTYTLSPGALVPADVEVGRRVKLYTEPGFDGRTQLVTRITTTSVTSEGDVKRVTEYIRTLPSGAITRTTTTSISGRVAVYEAGKTLTITRADGSQATYVINEKSRVPAGLAAGKTVAILPVAADDFDEPVAQTITYVTTTKTATAPIR
jgi:hypothetical protein